ncbi:MAG: serine/threonine-protein kinase [Planctomycetota bacterium]|nr:serine/threonine-protein kinase [Planctomycetota bacterium]
MNTIEEVIAEFLESVEQGKIPDREKMIAAHPDLACELREFFASHDGVFGARASGIHNSDERAPSLDSADEPRSPDSESSLIGGYRILEEIDRGGMGIVFKAHDIQLNRTVALKVIRSGRLASESDVQRFRSEAQAAAKLDHPGIVPVYEVGTENGQPYFSMAFVEGETLDSFQLRNRLSIEDSCSLVREIAIAIDHAHENGLIHRDLKPANILVDQNGRPRITDFGLVKSLENDDGLTATGEILGTINYMSPEQAAARNDQVDRRTDIYSLGAMLYFLGTGRPPFETDNPVDTLLRILDSEPTMANKVNSNIPGDIAVICRRCLEKKPGNRYPSAKALADDLERFLKGDPVEASRANWVSSLRRWGRREPSLAIHLIGLGLIEFTRACSYGTEIVFFGAEISDYLKYTVLIGLWAVACFVLQGLQNRLRDNRQILKYAWAATDISFLTLNLLMVETAIGPLYITYPLVIVVSGFFWRVRLVAFSTLLCLVSFLIVFFSHASESMRLHHGVIGLAAIIVIGYVMSLGVHRIRLLNRHFD